MKKKKAFLSGFDLKMYFLKATTSAEDMTFEMGFSSAIEKSLHHSNVSFRFSLFEGCNTRLNT
jgi:hypothetical protein